MTLHKPFSRRQLIRSGLRAAPALAASGLAAPVLRAATCGPTPLQGEGPFYPLVPIIQRRILVKPPDGAGKVGGEPIIVSGRVLDAQCQPVSGAVVEIWQADQLGRYNHRGERQEGALDPYFLYWGQTVTGTDGVYYFLTIFPAAYQAGGSWVRPPHIHYKIRSAATEELTTQLYFPDQPLNAKDFLYNQVPAARRNQVTAQRGGTPPGGLPKVPHYTFDVGLS